VVTIEVPEGYRAVCPLCFGQHEEPCTCTVDEARDKRAEWLGGPLVAAGSFRAFRADEVPPC
jgi:hypothetical protein